MNKTSFLKTLESTSFISFAAGYFWGNLQIATMALMAHLSLFTLLAVIMRHSLNNLQKGSWVAVMVLGGGGVMLQDDNLIKLKITIINFALSLSLLASHFYGKLSLIERVLKEHIAAPTNLLRKINLAAALYFFLTGLSNLWVKNYLSNDAWVQFKLFVLPGTNIIFLILCLIALKEWLPTDKS
ncbi:MAG: inner membrane-spanning protein YciB [Oligoflexales bacterium]